MENIYTYVVDLPDGFNEVVMPCMDGYTVYVNSKLSSVEQKKAYEHALFHIQNDDWSKDDVDEIERIAHETAE